MKKRISFLKRKTERPSDHSDPQSQSADFNINSNDSDIDSSSSLIDLDTYSKLKNPPKDIFLSNEILNIYDNPSFNEKIFLLKNNVDFCLLGKGLLRIIYGEVKVFGYTISSEHDLEDFEFDISDKYQLYTCSNKGSLVKPDSEEKLIKTCEKFMARKSFKNIKDFFSFNRDKISIVYFKDLSKNFEILNKNDLMSIKYDYVDLYKYENYLIDEDDRDKSIFSDNKKFLICGKKNSGKSTFLLFLINTVLSKIKETVKSVNTHQTHPYLFLLDCDSGQPLLSSPYNVSFIKINKPIFSNYYKNENLACETFKSLLVEESTPTNNFEDYIKSVHILSETYRQIQNSQSHFLIVNTNGYTSGLGNIINSSIIDIIKPDLSFYIKNKQSGRLEKGEEFENYILKEEEKSSLNIILRQYKLNGHANQSNLFNSTLHNRNKITNLEIKSILIQNDFQLKEEKNVKNKNLNKSLYVYSNLIGDEFSLNSDINFNKSDDNISFTLNDIIMSKDKSNLPLVKIPFDDIIFSFNFTEFTPKNELDILFSINAKMCFILHNSSTNEQSTTRIGNSNIIDYNKISHADRTFSSFAYVYNIDIIERKVILLSSALKNLKQEGNASGIKIILYRNISTLDKNIAAMKDSNAFESILMDRKFSSKNLFVGGNNDTNNEDAQVDSHSVNEEGKYYYFLRNKYSII